ncbi:MAG: L,D-transpeptidase family protein [Verrucomicrobiota bacterium]
MRTHIAFVLLLACLVEHLTATPMRLRQSSKRVESTKDRLTDRVLVDRNGKPLPRPFWKNNSPSGIPRVEVNLAKQVARVYFDDVLVGQSPICSGRPGHRTPTGEFTIINKSRDHKSNLYGSWINTKGQFMGEANAGQRSAHGYRYVPAPMPFFLRLTYGGVGFHAGYIAGFPASHGCIRLPIEMAERFFEHLPKKTKVVIINSG